MENRYSVHPEQAKRFTTAELREHFLIESLFVENKLNMFYSHEDRVVIGGAVPVKESIALDAGDFLKTDYFLERREIGIVNVGKPGAVKVGDEEYVLEHKDFLYIGLGNKDVFFSSLNEGGAKFYFISATAHQKYPVQKASLSELPIRSFRRRSLFKCS